MTEVFDSIAVKELRAEKFGLATEAAGQVSPIAPPAAAAAMTATLTGVDTGTDMTTAQAATIVADLAALKTAVDANNTAIDSLLTLAETFGLS
jgi:hypothetical protein